MLALSGVFVYQSVSRNLNDSIDETLLNRTGGLARLVTETPPSQIELGTSEDPEDSFSQVIRADGTLVDSTSPFLVEPVLDPGELAAVRDGETGFDVGELPGVDGDARLLAATARHEGERFVVVAGSASQDRDETLSGLVRTFLIAAPLALLLASLAGYGLATVAMRPVERMRRQAGEITLDDSGERLPLPASRDEIRRLGETLNDMLDRIEDSLERERTFVADASHDLRTPLAIISGELELGLKEDRDLASAREAMLSAREEVARLEGLTEDLLTLARADGARLPVDLAEVGIAGMLEAIRARFEPLARAKGRRLVVGTADPAVARLDRHRLDRALGNLVDNALAHGEGEVRLSATAEGGSVVFSVSDEGGGFPDEFRGEAFERFSRPESGRTDGGHGLGLAIVKAVAEAQGGTVSIESGATGPRVEMRIPLRGSGAGS